MPHSPLDTDVVSAGLLKKIADSACLLDRGNGETRTVFPRLGDEGLLDLGAPLNHDGTLFRQAEVISAVAGRCMSTAFSLWATRMSIEYLHVANTPYAHQWADRLATGERLGITGMASAFKDLAGCGTLDLYAEPADDGYVVNGSIRWASNLFDDSLLITATRTSSGGRMIIALPLTTEGVTVGKPSSLLALGSTASSSLSLEDVHVPAAQVLTHEVGPFLVSVRPTFMTLQTAMCLGLAQASIGHARENLVGVNAGFAPELDALYGQFIQANTALRAITMRIGTEDSPTRSEVLSLRLSAAQAATDAANLEIRLAGGKGFSSTASINRRFREATFIPVQSPSEGQLRWELASCY